MSEKIQSATEAATSSKIIIERTYRASVDELWELWTTKEGFGSWWAPEGFRAEVHSIEARVNGKLHYEMIAETPEMVATMKELGLPASHVEHARFSEFRPLERLVLAIMMDFLPRVTPYEGTTTVDFLPSGERVRMVVTLSPMHDEEFTKMAAAGLASQLRNLDKRFQSRTWPGCPPPVAAP
jgi:uncharacterized protein YndB with AHSA1/START domain